MRELRGNLNVSAFARLVELPQSSVRQYLDGSVPGADKAAQIADRCGVTLDWLIKGVGPREAAQQGLQANLTHPIDLSGFTMIPRLDVEAAAGYGALAETEDPQSLLAFNSAWLRRRGINPASAHVLTARGDSMEPTIRSGDILLVDTSIDRIDDNGIYIVRVGGMLLVKRIHVMMSRSLLLISDNKDLYPPEEISSIDAADMHVAGRVMWFGRSI